MTLQELDGLNNIQLARLALSAKLKTMNSFELLAEKVADKELSKKLLDMVKEEEVHIGELSMYLLENDPNLSEEEPE